MNRTDLYIPDCAYAIVYVLIPAPGLIAQHNQANCTSPTSCMMIKEDVEAPPH